MSSTPVREFDVVIVGGGLVGACLACALAPLGLRIAVLEAVPLRASDQPSYDDRTLALSASSCQILRGLGLWPQLEPQATAIREILVTELERPGRVVLRPSELGLDCFGHVVEAREFGRAVLGLLAGFANVELLCPALFTAIENGDGLARVRCSRDGHEQLLAARLVVAADGAESPLRSALGIAAERHDYGQVAVVCNITPEQAHRGRAFECFTPTGPFAVLPHVNGRCGLVWSVDSVEGAALMELPDDEFLARAQRRFGDALGRWQRVGRRSAYPLRLVRAERDFSGRAVLLGNAAHAIHPIGAQGFNLGLRDVAVLAELIASARCRDAAADIGSAELLGEYSRWRAPDQAGTIAWSDGLARLFANPTGLAGIARQAGLIAHALLPPLRRRLAIGAMGFRGRIPRLALGEPLARA